MSESESIHRHPIVVIAFDRAMYLEQVLQSLSEQVDAELEQRTIALFQDAAVNAVSGARKAKDEDILACADLFKRFFPSGHVFVAESNLGVALNFDRAEKYVFEQLNADAAVFIEDDMTLSPHYLNSLDHLMNVALADDRIGHVAVYGHHWVPVKAQMLAPGHLVLLEHNWAFGLTQRQWRKNKPFVEQYLQVVRTMDYSKRDAKPIHQLYKTWGLGCPGDSQDVTKTLACCLTGAVKLNTQGCLGKYIGERGLHMDPARFESRGYSKTELYSEPIVSFEPLTKADYDRIMTPQVRWATEIPCRC